MKINYEKGNGLVPAIIQDANTNKILMLGFMNDEALQTTRELGRVTLYSRSKKRLWTKGETSGNYLNVKEILTDCDQDTILVKVDPVGPVCHTGKDTCFNEINKSEKCFLFSLEKTIKDRKENESEKSYTSKLFKEGNNRIAQKVGEEATEVVIAAASNDKNNIKEESADLLFHLLVLLSKNEIELEEIETILKNRHLEKIKNNF